MRNSREFSGEDVDYPPVAKEWAACGGVATGWHPVLRLNIAVTAT